MAIQLVPLCTIHLQFRPPIDVGAGLPETPLVFEL
jgi:hypothetical protein